MAAKKNSAAKRNTGKTASRSSSSKKKTQQAQASSDNKVIWSAVLFVLGLLMLAFTVITGENLWLTMHNVLLGAFGVAAILVPFVLIYAAVMLAKDKEKNTIAGKVIQGVILILILCAAAEIFSAEKLDPTIAKNKLAMDLMEKGKSFKGGGLLSFVLGIPLLSLFGKAGASVVIVLLTVFFILLLSNKTVVDVVRWIKHMIDLLLDARPEYEPVPETAPTQRRRRQEEVPAQVKPERRAEQNAQSENAERKPLFGGLFAKKKEEAPAAPQRSYDPVEENRRDFNIDIAFPFEAKEPPKKAQAKKSGLEQYNYDPVFDVPDDNLPGEVPAVQPASQKKPAVQKTAKETAVPEKTETEIEVERYQQEIDLEQRRRAYQLQKKRLGISDDSVQAADVPDDTPASLDEIIRKASSGAETDTVHTEPDVAAPLPVPQPTPSPVYSAPANTAARSADTDHFMRKPHKASTLASNQIGDDEDLDLPETTARDIQNEIAKNDAVMAEYEIPPLALLNVSKNELNKEQAAAEMKSNSRTLLETLESFGISAEIVDIKRGSAVTRYELLPKAGIKISKIKTLSDDIAMRLASMGGIRIEAPIPGKAAIGIEVPNKVKDVVTLRDVLDTEEFRSNRSKLTFAVGKNIDSGIVLGDIAKLPHMIIAGTTGSGKSVCTNGIIMSILYNATPQEVRLVLIDPKMVEFKIYNGIPHLLLPVVTDPRKAAGALSWAVQEMLKRYKLFSDNSVRDLYDYNELASHRDDLETIPRIVIIIDELADLMMAAKSEVEDSICRLAQMARAAGMHIIIATQRPTVDVVTGLIKSNIPSRIALRVASGVDSRTILDETGAEKLLGNGDLLYMPTGAPKPIRVQNCYTSSKEVAAVVDFIKNGSGNVTYDENIIKAVEENVPQPKGEKPADNGKTYEGSDDDLTERAIECAIDAGSAGVSVSYLQRKLVLGYPRAARIMEQLENLGVVGPSNGAKPRQVLVTRETYVPASQVQTVSDEEQDQ
ncbi:MAG: DNA translocase FtsK 4TM domain-containing protein [Oscillospiraceae bacterium]|nr:DNA translocase FtsK 4TM domain-containing protein [Oscillospiraceae bacterium]